MPKLKKITEQSTPEEKEKLVYALIKWLVKHEVFCDISIYCNNKCWKSDYYQSTDKFTNMQEIHNEKISPEPFYLVQNIKAKDYIEFANENLITMSFEGPLYHELNYGNGKTYQELQKFFEKRGLYFEQGYAWSLSVYE